MVDVSRAKAGIGGVLRTAQKGSETADIQPSIIKADISVLLNDNLARMLDLTSVTKICGVTTLYSNAKPFIIQNVAEHEGNVTKIALVLSDYLNMVGVRNDTGKVLRMAIMHADDEMLSRLWFIGEIDDEMLGGDEVPHLARYWHTRNSDEHENDFRNFDYRLDQIACKEIRDGYTKDYHEYKKGITLESAIIKLADYADSVIYTNIEMTLGNKSFASEREMAKEKFNAVLTEVLRTTTAPNSREWDNNELSKFSKDITRLVNDFLMDMLSKTSSTPRYSTVKVHRIQNVAEHEGNVTKIALVLSDYLKMIGVPIDTETVLRAAIMHDDDEIVSGDLPHSAKYMYGERSDALRKALNGLNEVAIGHQLGKIPFKELRDKYKSTLRTYEERATIESLIVKLSDFADVINFTGTEKAFGNESIIKDEKNAKRKFNALLEETLDAVTALNSPAGAQIA